MPVSHSERWEIRGLAGRVLDRLPNPSGYRLPKAEGLP
jgi:hypothetical protein